MSVIIDRIRAKVTRAKQHIQDLEIGLASFRDTKPYHFSVKEDPQRGQRIYYVTQADCVPDSLTVIAADVIQNLRSPLDHIAYQLVLDARKGTRPDWLVYYPICGSAADYPATRTKKIKGVRQEVIDAIDATEPYKGGKGHALWQLNELNKPDKHHLLMGAAGFSSAIDISVDFNQMIQSKPGFESVKFPPLFLYPADRLLGVKKGDEIYCEPLDYKMAKDRRFAFQVSFNAPGIIEPESVLKTLNDMTNLVDHIVTTLGQFLP